MWISSKIIVCGNHDTKSLDSDGYSGGVTQASSLQWELATFDTPQVPENVKNLDIRTLVRRSGKLYNFNTIPITLHLRTWNTI